MKKLLFMLSFWNDEGGISSVEYALLLAFIAAAIIFSAQELSFAVQGELSATAMCITFAVC